MITYKIRRKSSTNEWIVRKYINGKADFNCDYFTDDKRDAIDTKAFAENLIGFNMDNSILHPDLYKRSNTPEIDLKTVLTRKQLNLQREILNFNKLIHLAHKIECFAKTRNLPAIRKYHSEIDLILSDLERQRKFL